MGVQDIQMVDFSAQDFSDAVSDVTDDKFNHNAPSIKGGVLDEEAQMLVPDGKDTTSCFGRMFKVYETNWQCPGISFATCSTVIAVAGVVLCLVGVVIGGTGADVTQQAIGYSIAVVGGLVAVTCFANCIGHCISCTAIGHYVPERAFETNVGRLGTENKMLILEVEDLKQNAEFLQGILDRQKSFVGEQKLITAGVDEMLQSRTDELGKVNLDLEKNIEELAKAKVAIDQFEEQLGQLSHIMCVLASSNKEFKNKLDDLDITTDELGEQKIEWDKDLNQFEGGNDQYQNLNSQAQQLGAALNQQLSMFAQFSNAIESNLDKIGKQVVSLDQTDDKVKETSQNLKATVEAKEKQLQRTISIYNKNRDALVQVKVALQKLENVEGWENIFKPLIEVIDETSESSFDSDTLTKDSDQLTE